MDGHRTHVLVVEPFTRMPGLGAGAEEADEVAFQRATLFLDAEMYVLRRMELEGSMDRDGQTRAVTVTGRFEDYRAVEGMLHPFRTVMTAEGMAPAVSAGEREQARRSMAELRAQVESMPLAQRQMMEGTLRSQMEQIESMLGGGGLDMVTEVRELRVNAGPPGGR